MTGRCPRDPAAVNAISAAGGAGAPFRGRDGPAAGFRRAPDWRARWPRRSSWRRKSALHSSASASELTNTKEGRMNAAARKLECDLVMKGGITSGVIYPRLVAKLAQV